MLSRLCSGYIPIHPYQIETKDGVTSKLVLDCAIIYNLLIMVTAGLEDTAQREKLHALYATANITRVIRPRPMRWVGHVARMGVRSSAYRVLVGKPGGKIPLGMHRRMWEDNIKTGL
jgi:hypothetical protein